MNDDLRGWSSDLITVARWKVLIEAYDYSEANPGLILGVQMAGARTQVGTAAARKAYEDGVGRGWLQSDQGLSPERYGLMFSNPGLIEVTRWVKTRNSPKYRKIACREALLEWLYAQDEEVPTADPFLGDTRASHYGRAFIAGEVRRATEDLVRDGLVSGVTSWQNQPSRLTLTSGGRGCVEAYDGVIADWQVGQRGASTTSYNGDVFNINADGSTGTQIAAGSSNVRQRAEVAVTYGGASEILPLLERLTVLIEALPLPPAEADEVRESINGLGEELTREEPDRGRVRQVLGMLLTTIATVATEAGVQEIMQLGGQIMGALGGTASPG